MKIVRTDRPVLINSDGAVILYKPFVRYVVSDYEAECLLSGVKVNWQWSSFNPYERRYGGQDLNGKSVCIYRHTAFGDQLMISAVPKYLKTLYPRSIVHFYCHPNMTELWRGSSFIDGGALPIPMELDALRAYDYHILYEGMLENNGEDDQENCYDDFFSFIGLRDVPDEFKKPFIFMLPTDIELLPEDAKHLVVRNCKYVIVHVSPANKNRCYPPQQAKGLVEIFLNDESFKSYSVVLVGKEDAWVRGVFDVFEGHSRVINLIDRVKNFRGLIPLVQGASAVVCPDSSLLHLAAGLKVPTVSLWGLFHPNDRAKYYKTDHPIFRKEACKFAPCRNHDFTLPLEKCTKNELWVDGSEYCLALSFITAEKIMKVLKEVVFS
ncbi:MAG: glycosyltransferase family 9 protein [Candidatus Methanomethylicaceae archaeon]